MATLQAPGGQRRGEGVGPGAGADDGAHPPSPVRAAARPFAVVAAEGRAVVSVEGASPRATMARGPEVDHRRPLAATGQVRLLTRPVVVVVRQYGPVAATTAVLEDPAAPAVPGVGDPREATAPEGGAEEPGAAPVPARVGSTPVVQAAAQGVGAVGAGAEARAGLPEGVPHAAA